MWAIQHSVNHAFPAQSSMELNCESLLGVGCGSGGQFDNSTQILMETDEKPGHFGFLPEYKVEVRVTDPQADSSKGFYTYLVSGTDELGEFEIRRRYNDFFYLRESLVKIWPALYIPPIPEKKIAGNKDAENIEIRKKFFDYFLKRLSKTRHFYKAIPTQEFLRNKNIDMEKYFATLTAPRFAEQVIDYRKIFEGVVDLSPARSADAKIVTSSFGTFLKKAEKELENLRQQLETIVDARAGFTLHLNNCNSSMLPEYEKNVYLEYLPDEEKKDPNLIFVNNPHVQNNIAALREVAAVNSFASTLDLITYEILEVRAMDEALKTKERLETLKQEKSEELLTNQAELAKLMGGKTTLKSIFSRGSKSEQITKLERENPELERQIKGLGEFNELVGLIFGLVELPTFKREKQLQYYRMMYEVSENELKYLSSYGEFMKSIMQGLQK